MATSGVTTFNPEFAEIIDQACSIAGFNATTGYEMRSARFAANMLFAEWQNRGLNLWTISSGSTALTQGTATYNLPADAVDMFEVDIRTNAGNITLQSDLHMNRISTSVYSSIPNKLTQGRPIQYLVNRLVTPTITLWPVPDGTQTWTMFYYYLRRIQDSGSNVGYTADMPTRFLPPLVMGLAYQMAMRKPELSDRVIPLKAAYEEQFDLSAGEDREKASVRLIPWTGSMSGGQ